MSEVVNLYEHEKFKDVYIVELDDGTSKLATKNLVPGKRVYGEHIYRWRDEEYREWNTYRSKLAAAIVKGLKEMPIRKGQKILYLGAGSGTTPSHVSDIVGYEGTIYAVEFAPRVMRELIVIAEDRKNIIPILEDARMPRRYRHLIEGVDGLYADVAQPEQASIVADNADMFLIDGGWLLLAIKARSIDVTAEPSEIYRKEIETLRNRGFEIVDVVHLEPFDKDHAMVCAIYHRRK